MSATRASLESFRRKPKIISVPEHGDFAIRELSVEDFDLWQEQKLDAGKGSSAPILLALSLVDADTGEKLFKPEEWQSVRQLVPFRVNEALWQHIVALNGFEFKPKGEQELGTDLKNSATTPS